MADLVALSTTSAIRIESSPLSAARRTKSGSIGVIDIFAGPGGLGEGFSSFEAKPGSGEHPFKLAVSAEMEKSAHATLRLRAFYRLLTEIEGPNPKAYQDYLDLVARGTAAAPSAHFPEGKWGKLWEEAEREALNLTLGTQADNERLYERIRSVRGQFDDLVLIGGPPCQAYSLVGRARQKNVKGFLTRGDHRHFLYREYLGILAEFAPAVFIMENVKGILTSKVGQREMFDAIRRDLADPSAAIGRPGAGSKYVLLPIHVPAGQTRSAELVERDPSGFIIRCEDHGAPQARHRVIIMGVREDCLGRSAAETPGLPVPPERTTIEDALAGLPALRSGLSRGEDTGEAWMRTVESQRRHVLKAIGRRYPEAARVLEQIEPSATLARSANRYTRGSNAFTAQLRTSEQTSLLNHETRGHMTTDLGRYLFCSAFAAAYGASPSSEDFPGKLAPEHANWESGAFADRFRVQVRSRPSSTITSHLSKDGHAFIHWDPAQCRSLTVREAARLQTFPDDYLFLGNRTQQFVQVGNAVPPIIARHIASTVSQLLTKAGNLAG